MNPVFPDMKALQAAAGGASAQGKALPKGAQQGDTASSGERGQGRMAAARIPEFGELVERGAMAEGREGRRETRQGGGEADTALTRIDPRTTARALPAPWPTGSEAGAARDPAQTTDAIQPAQDAFPFDPPQAGAETDTAQDLAHPALPTTGAERPVREVFSLDPSQAGIETDTARDPAHPVLQAAGPDRPARDVLPFAMPQAGTEATAARAFAHSALHTTGPERPAQTVVPLRVGAELAGPQGAAPLAAKPDAPAVAPPSSGLQRGDADGQGAKEIAPRVVEAKHPGPVAAPTASRSPVPVSPVGDGAPDAPEIATDRDPVLPVIAKPERPAAAASAEPRPLSPLDRPQPDRFQSPGDQAAPPPRHTPPSPAESSAVARPAPAPLDSGAPLGAAPRPTVVPASGVRTEGMERVPSPVEMPPVPRQRTGGIVRDMTAPRTVAATPPDVSPAPAEGSDEPSRILPRSAMSDRASAGETQPARPRVDASVDGGVAPAPRSSVDAPNRTGAMAVENAQRPVVEGANGAIRQATVETAPAAARSVDAGPLATAPAQTPRAEGDTMRPDAMPAKGGTAPDDGAPAVRSSAETPVRSGTTPMEGVNRPVGEGANGAARQAAVATAETAPADPTGIPATATTRPADAPPLAATLFQPLPAADRPVAERPARLREIAPADAATAPRASYASPDRFAARSVAPRNDARNDASAPAPARVASRVVDPYSIAATMNEPVTSAEAARTLAAASTAPTAPTAATPAPPVASPAIATPPVAMALAAQMTGALPVEEALSKSVPGSVVDGVGDSPVGLVSRGGEGGTDVRQTAAPLRPMTAEGADALQEIVRTAVLTKGPTTIELRLDPSELGKIDIELSFVDDRVSIMVRGDREDALDMMRRSSDELARMLRQSGLDLDTLGFSRDQPGDGDREQGFGAMAGETSGDGAGEGVGEGAAEGPGDSRETAYAAARPGAGRDRVDIRI